MLGGVTRSQFLKNGKFSFAFDSVKVDDDFDMLVNFGGERVYMPFYGIDLSNLIQKNTSYFVKYQPLILGSIRNKINTQMPDDVVLQSLASSVIRNEKSITITPIYSIKYLPQELFKTVILI
jgi:hypothetical protein